MLTFEQIKELIDLVSSRGLAGLEIDRAGFRLRIDGTTGRGVQSPSATAEAGLPEPTAGPPAAEAGTASSDEDALPPGTHVLTSPIVGTFYRAPAPDADPYVEVGAKVRKGQVLCIVEAMKLMNEIEADVDGAVLEVLPQNGQAVEFGEPLFAIRPD
ncbi:MAG TPA: acetyl-CoA carboxylase biotin carboxyl carrier protein [Thermoanaerobaculia bacterium]|nr:acetyl-CoA carboxylase biotin carboxyl carrier protein [Thermoanaerobaculia bacterium]